MTTPDERTIPEGDRSPDAHLPAISGSILGASADHRDLLPPCGRQADLGWTIALSRQYRVDRYRSWHCMAPEPLGSAARDGIGCLRRSWLPDLGIHASTSVQQKQQGTTSRSTEPLTRREFNPSWPFQPQPSVEASPPVRGLVSFDVRQKIMNKAKVIDQVESRFGIKSSLTHLEQKEWFMEADSKNTWKAHLTNTFKRRIEKGKEKFGSTPAIQEGERFLEALNKFTEKNELYSFSTDSDEHHFGGWMIDEKMVYCIGVDRDTQEPLNPKPNQSQ